MLLLLLSTKNEDNLYGNFSFTATYHNRHNIKMGYEVTSFVGEVDAEFVCTVCMMVVEKPLVSPCDHIFCTKCILKWITLHNNCPVDRRSLQANSLKTAPRFYRNLWSKLKVKCQLRKLSLNLLSQMIPF